MAERIRLALSLGDADLDQYVRARSLADDVDADLAALPETMRQRWLAARKR